MINGETLKTKWLLECQIKPFGMGELLKLFSFVEARIKELETPKTCEK